jgi:hypothetical protein
MWARREASRLLQCCDKAVHARANTCHLRAVERTNIPQQLKRVDVKFQVARQAGDSRRGVADGRSVNQATGDAPKPACEGSSSSHPEARAN